MVVVSCEYSFHSSNRFCGLAQLCPAVQSLLFLAVSRKGNVIFFSQLFFTCSFSLPKTILLTKKTYVLLMAKEIKILYSHGICRDSKIFSIAECSGVWREMCLVKKENLFQAYESCCRSICQWNHRGQVILIPVSASRRVSYEHLSSSSFSTRIGKIIKRSNGEKVSDFSSICC